MYAVNVADLTTITGPDRLPIEITLLPHLNPKAPPVDAEPGRVDGAAAQMFCPEVQASAIVEILRERFPKYRLRFYYSPTGGAWERV